MFKKVTLSVLLALVFSAFALVAQAQDALESGVAVSGEITDDTSAVEYSYEGKEGEVIVVELFPVDILADYDQPKIVVNDADGNEVVSYSGYGNTTLYAILPADGAYTIVATREDDTSVGEYTLTLTVPQELAVGDSVQGTLETGKTGFYVVRSDDDFAVGFARDGALPAELSVNTVDQDIVPGTLNAQGTLGGAQVVRGSIGNFAGGEVYLIRVGEPLFYFSFEDETADYGIAIAEPIE